MAKRTGILSPIQLVTIEAHEEAMNLPQFLEKLPTVDYRSLAYSCLVQAGFDRLQIVSQGAEDLPSRSGVRGKVVLYTGNYWVQSFALVHDMFRRYIPNLEKKIEQNDRFHDLLNFLADVIFALAERKPIIVPRIPTLSATIGDLPPELLVPISNLFSAFERLNILSPVPVAALNMDSVARFQEIISSDAFESYVQAQCLLEDGAIEARAYSEFVATSARTLCKRYDRYVLMKRIAVTLLPFSAKLIEKILGDFPGDIADYASSAAQRWLNDDRRLLIYRFDDTFKQAFEARLASYMRLMGS